VFTRELADLWIGGKALNLILIYSIVLGIIVYVLASNSELSLIPPKEMVFETLRVVIAIGAIISLIIGADSISGERERATLEGLLLTPASRRQIVLGKFLAAVSPWPVALAIAVPYCSVLSQGDEVFGQAVLWGAIMGSLLAPALTGLGMLVSIWSNSNKTSFFISLGIYLLLLVPAQLPGRAQTGATGEFLQWVNPTAAADHLLEKILVNNRTLGDMGSWLTAPVLLLVLVLGLLFLYAGPGLRLEAGNRSRFRSSWSRVVGLLVAGGLMVSLGTPPTMAFRGETVTGAEQLLQIAIDVGYKVVKMGEPLLFDTVVTNHGTEASPPLTVAMNIVNLETGGDVVDPEDWSPQRTQYTEAIAPGQSTKHAWRVNAILDGDYMVYMVVIPKPGGEQATSQPVASSGIHLTVTPFTRLNPAGVLPYAIGGPSVLLLGVLVLYWLRRRQIEIGGN
jgi:ABC-2 type transport system permease protein